MFPTNELNELMTSYIKTFIDDYLQAMRIIGKNVDIDIVLKNKNTLFF